MPNHPNSALPLFCILSDDGGVRLQATHNPEPPKFRSLLVSDKWWCVTARRRQVIGQAGVDLRAVAAQGQDLLEAPLQLEAADGSAAAELRLSVLIGQALARMQGVP